MNQLRQIERMQDEERPKYQEMKAQALVFHWRDQTQTQYIPFPPAYAALEQRILAPYADRNYLVVLGFLRSPAKPMRPRQAVPDTVQVEFDVHGQMRVKHRGFRQPVFQGRAREVMSPPKELTLVSTQGERASFDVVWYEKWREWFKYERGMVVLKRK